VSSATRSSRRWSDDLMPCHVVAAEESADGHYEPKGPAASPAGTATAATDAKRDRTD
jgi:hypothetical protein